MKKHTKILEGHKKQGKIFLPPFVHMIGPIQEVSWIKTILPELCWIGLIQYQHGHQRGTEVITSLSRLARSVRSTERRESFAAVSSYSQLSDPEWVRLREKISAMNLLFLLRDSLEPLITLYPQCPLRPLYDTPPVATPKNALLRMRELVSSLLYRENRDPMMVQATAIWLAFDSDLLKVKKGLALSQFPEIEKYPDTDLSLMVGSSIRATLNMIFGDDDSPSQATAWPRYFWNRGLELTPCEISDD